MNKIVFALLVGMFFSACQNTPKNASENTTVAPNTPALPAPATAEDMQEAVINITTGVTMMENLRKQVDALPAKVKKEKATEIDGLYNDLEGMIAKQSKMLNDLKSTMDPASQGGSTQEGGAPEGINAAMLQDYSESAARYAKAAQEMQVAIAKLNTQEQ